MKGQRITVDDLKLELREYGLSVSGNKRVLIERLEEAQRSNKRKLNEPIAEITIEPQTMVATFEGASLETVPVNVMLENIVPNMEVWDVISLSISSKRWYRILHNYLDRCAKERYGPGATPYCFSIELTFFIINPNQERTLYPNDLLKEASILLCCSKSKILNALEKTKDTFTAYDITTALLIIYGTVENYLYRRKRNQKSMKELLREARSKLKCSILSNYTLLYDSLVRQSIFASSVTINKLKLDSVFEELRTLNHAPYPLFDTHVRRQWTIRFALPRIDLPDNTYYWDGQIPPWFVYLEEFLADSSGNNSIAEFCERCWLQINIIMEHKHLFTFIDPLKFPALMRQVYRYATRNDFDDIFVNFITRRIALLSGAEHSLFVYASSMGILDKVKAAPKFMIYEYLTNVMPSKSISKLIDLVNKIKE